MPIVNTAIGMSESVPSASYTLGHSPSGTSTASNFSGPVQPNGFIGVSVGCASLAAILTGIFVWTCLKRRKGKDGEIKNSNPDLLSQSQEAKPRTTLDLDLEKGMPLGVPDIIITPPDEDLTMTTTDDSDSTYTSEADSRGCPGTPAQDDDDFDFKCCGLDDDDEDDSASVTGDSGVQFDLFSESIYETKRFYWSTSTSLTPEDDEAEELLERIGQASLMTISEEDESDGDILVPLELIGKDPRPTLDTIDEEAEKCDASITLAMADCEVEKVEATVTEIDATVVSEEDTHLGQDKQMKNSPFHSLPLLQPSQPIRNPVVACTDSNEDATRDSNRVSTDPAKAVDQAIDEETSIELKECSDNDKPSPCTFSKPASDNMDDTCGPTRGDKDAGAKVVGSDSTCQTELSAVSSVSPPPALLVGQLPQLPHNVAEIPVALTSENDRAVEKSVGDRRKRMGFFVDATEQTLSCLRTLDTGIVASVMDGTHKDEHTDHSADVANSQDQSTLTSEVDAVQSDSQQLVDTRTSDTVPDLKPDCQLIHQDTACSEVPESLVVGQPINKSDKASTVAELLGGDGPSANGQCNPPWWDVLEMIKQDPQNCDGKKLFREWAIKNGLASRNTIKKKPSLNPLIVKNTSLPKSGPVSLPKVHPTSAIPTAPVRRQTTTITQPRMDRGAHKRELEKRFREWWAAGNESIFGPSDSPPVALSSEKSSPLGEDGSSGCELRPSGISLGESSELSSPPNEHAVIAYHNSVRSSSFNASVELDCHWMKDRGLNGSLPSMEPDCQQTDQVPPPSTTNSPGSEPPSALGSRRQINGPSSQTSLLRTVRENDKFTVVQKGEVTQESPVMACASDNKALPPTCSPDNKASVKTRRTSMSVTGQSPSPRRTKALSASVTSPSGVMAPKPSGSLIRIASTSLPSKEHSSRTLSRAVVTTPGPTKSARTRSMSTVQPTSASPGTNSSPSQPKRKSIASPTKPAWGSPSGRPTKVTHTADRSSTGSVRDSTSSFTPLDTSTPKTRRVLSRASTLMTVASKAKISALGHADISEKENAKPSDTTRLRSQSSASVETPRIAKTAPSAH